MMKYLRKGYLWAAALAAALLLAAAVGRASAYFTTYVTAKGGYTLNLQDKTAIQEDFNSWTKHISVQNTGNADCFIRVKAFAGSQFTLHYSGGEKWSLGADGYYYYSGVLAAGATADELLVKIELPQAQAEGFNVVVVQESTAVLHKADGTAYADWSMKVDTSYDQYNVEGAQG